MSLAVLADDRVQPRQAAKPALSIARNDDLLSERAHREVREFLHEPGWRFGWKSHAKKDQFSFWHKHFTGTKHIDPDAEIDEDTQQPLERIAELRENAPVIHAFWEGLHATVLKGHRLVRCYANAFSFGCEGTLHCDSRAPNGYTCIYYPHERWEPNWGGETVFFNTEKTDIVASVYPMPNRMVMFNGCIPHVARGLTRSCPTYRITLMFKTEKIE